MKMSKNVLITGATGFVGTYLTEFLIDRGYDVIILSRSAKGNKGNVAYWNPERGEIDIEALKNLDAAVHLAGENIAGRWTDHKKTRIDNSRVLGTKLLSESLASLNKKPEVLISASAIGIYGNRGDEILTEASSHGQGFLADVGVKWEEATKIAKEAGIRIGGKIGDGKQYWSWIAIDDLVEIIYYLLKNKNLEGPVNAVSPNPVTNSEFTRALGQVLNRPTLIPLPAFAARGLLGEMADETMLSSTRVIPQKLLDAGFKFKYMDLKNALSGILKTEI